MCTIHHIHVPFRDISKRLSVCYIKNQNYTYGSKKYKINFNTPYNMIEQLI